MGRAALIFLALGVAAAQSGLRGFAESSRKEKCDVNDHVTCPYSGVRCSGNQCCPGVVETGGWSFVCPSASSLGPWSGEIPSCELLTKIEDCTEATGTLPTSNAWRVRADSTESGWAWDIRTLTFKDASGADLQLGGCQAFSSGSASDTKHAGIPGYEAEHAFDGSNLWWGGRSGSTGKFFLGLRCEQQYAVAQVQIQQGDAHYAQEVTVEWQDEADNWVPLQTASGLFGGWSMERIYPSGDSSTPSTSMTTTTPSTSSREASCKFSVVFCGYSGYSSGEDASAPPAPENWELMVGECSPDGRGGAYRVDKPSSPHPFDPECGIASPYYVHVDHYPEETCTSAKDDSSFMVFTDGYCGNCCDISTGVCNSRCAGFLSPA